MNTNSANLDKSTIPRAGDKALVIGPKLRNNPPFNEIIGKIVDVLTDPYVYNGSVPWMHGTIVSCIHAKCVGHKPRPISTNRLLRIIPDEETKILFQENETNQTL